ncbi:RAD3-like DNA-binding helicase protein [Arabidopsis thaliana]|uniref:DNA 5'-3' helicase FANCJ n=1 Tax=Arabidopsis thaliana TaxID=3702 RepID=F4HUN4_ARATH|nr:RAD3-like DNA-binding helicase protein [Arabidopsis thaliana]AEE30014.1 RAD3-like DNA-binding helicase protein [Arabidopsis thaliana]|eukprot:NP_173495.5 RAD3-like DNA-binding helicase protein [Arabidopsis thaliana]
MVSSTSKSDSKEEVKQTLNSKNPKNVYQIGGLQVEFPYQPYGTQLAFMSRVISTLDRAQRDGHCHALLESPTGTGKSLSLLCSVLAWQQNYKSRLLKGNLSHSKAAPEAATDPLNHGGGFIPETQPSDTPASTNVEKAETATKKRTKIPTIYYASRTHSQITQVIREYRKTGYRVPMAVLASRKHYCTNRHVLGKDNVDDECRLLLKDKANIQCSEFKNVNKITSHPSLQPRGHNEVHDIEDLVKVGKNVRGCPYFASWSMAENAQLVFCPYSYIVNPVIRAGVEVDLKGAIIIFDEAHNMEDIAREAGSINLEEDTLFKLQNELEQMSVAQPMIYQPLCEVVEGLISWIGRKKDSLAKRDFQHYFSSWTGDKALRELEESNITRECFPILLECFTKAIRTSKEAEMESDMLYLSGISVLTLEELFSSLTYFFSRNGSHILDYQLGLQRSTKRGDPSGTWTHTFSLWCMNPAVVFKDLADISLSVILTSGTLSPMNSFSSELGMQFGTSLEAPHVIDPNMQVWAGAISNGPSNYPLNASYKTADAYSFQDALGKSLEEICTIVPGGSLVFFPSYKLMEKLCMRWRETEQWSRLCLKKDLFVEPRGGAQDEFDSVLKGYYDSIRGKNKIIGRNRRAKKAGPIKTETQDDSKKGAAFLAVCRGKVSEGIDFADDNARAVIIVGIPFPNLHDIQVGLKKKYNDTYKSSKSLLGGSEWYCQQAYRALNQAAGRCIRHRFDYGAIIFLDERYKEQRNRASISKWLRQSIKVYDNFEASMEGLRSFFNSVKEQVDSKMLGSQEDSVEKNFSSEKQSKEFRRKENQIQNKSSQVEPKVEDYTNSNPKYHFMYESKAFGYHRDVKPKIAEDLRSMGHSAQTFVQVKEEAECCREVIDLECGVQPDLGYCEVSSVTNCDEAPETSFVQETSGMINGISVASPCSCSMNESSSPATVGLRSPGSPDQLLKQHISTPNFRKSPLGTESSVVATSERYSFGGTRSLTLEAESSFNMSVNSQALKRRKFTSSPVIDLEVENSDAPRPNCSMVNQRLCRKFEGLKGQGIWCEQDGCVFNTIYCPFCSIPNTCLGVQVMATDSSNVQFLSKILFFADHLEVTNEAASKDSTLKHKEPLAETNAAVDKSDVLKSIDRFAYSPNQQQESGGWRTTKSKLRLPKRNLPTSKKA